MRLSPHTAPALSDDGVAPVQELSHSGEEPRGDYTPSERFAGNRAFPMKIGLVRSETRFFFIRLYL